MDVKTPLRLLPRPFTAAMIASEIPAAIRPYSIAVAPDSSDRKRKNLTIKATSTMVVSAAADRP